MPNPASDRPAADPIRLTPRDLVVAALLVALVAVLYLRPVLAGTGSFLAHPDAQDQTYAWFQKLAQAWQRGYLPLWNHSTTGGYSFPGEIQTSVFYPLYWLWLALFARDGAMPPVAIDALIVLHFAIAAVGMYGLARRAGLVATAAAAAALSFALTGPIAFRAMAQANIFFGLCWMPWVLWAALVHRSSRHGRSAATTGALLGLQVVSGHVQPAVHTALLVACLWLPALAGEGWRERFTRYLKSGVAVASCALLVAGPQLYLARQYLGDAYRWVGAPNPLAPGKYVPWTVFGYRFILEPKDWLSAIDPWRYPPDDSNALYSGSLALLAVAWLLWQRRRLDAMEPVRRYVRPLAWIVAVSLVVCVGHFTFVAPILRVVPVLGQIRELARTTVIVQFALAALFGIAVDALLRRRFVPLPWSPVAITVALVLVAFELVWLRIEGSVFSPAALLQLSVASAVLALVLCSRPAQGWTAPLVIAVLLLQSWACRPLVLPVGAAADLLAPRFDRAALFDRVGASVGRFRVDIADDAGLSPNYADLFPLQTRRGYGATMNRPYFDFLAADWSVEGKVYDLLNVEYIVSTSELPLPKVGAPDGAGRILYRRPTALPRVFLHDDFDPTGGGHADPAAVQVDSYDDHLQRFRFHAARDGRAVVSELVYPGWCARVDGKPVTLGAASWPGLPTPLREVPVHAGDNLIEFRYRPFASRLSGCD